MQKLPRQAVSKPGKIHETTFLGYGSSTNFRVGRKDSSRFFLAAGFFLRILSPDFFSSFCGEKCPAKSSGKSPAKSSKIYTKNPRHICAEGPGQQMIAEKFQRCAYSLCGAQILIWAALPSESACLRCQLATCGSAAYRIP